MIQIFSTHGRTGPPEVVEEVEQEVLVDLQRGLKTLRSCTLGHLSRWVDENPVYEDNFGAS